MVLHGIEGRTYLFISGSLSRTCPSKGPRSVGSSRNKYSTNLSMAAGFGVTLNRLYRRSKSQPMAIPPPNHNWILSSFMACLPRRFAMTVRASITARCVSQVTLVGPVKREAVTPPADMNRD
jgi:hypothetical protein